ncbi:hypothetical protein SDC9_163157 [bioreactor metagenome]|uniref:Uncharacterized protein n=1 Tax=bioreactor metagenome TaxID=1076179 RepID=A0A645FN34_9ZZZZ
MRVIKRSTFTRCTDVGMVNHAAAAGRNVLNHDIDLRKILSQSNFVEHPVDVRCSVHGWHQIDKQIAHRVLFKAGSLFAKFAVFLFHEDFIGAGSA